MMSNRNKMKIPPAEKNFIKSVVDLYNLPPEAEVYKVENADTIKFSGGVWFCFPGKFKWMKHHKKYKIGDFEWD